MPDQKVYSQAEMKMWMKHLVEQLPKHDDTAEATKKEFDKLYSVINDIPNKLGCAKQTRRINKLETAIYGDKEDDTNEGMKVQVEYIHSIVKGAKTAGWMFRLLVYVILSMAAIGGTILAFKGWVLNN